MTLWELECSYAHREDTINWELWFIGTKNMYTPASARYWRLCLPIDCSLSSVLTLNSVGISFKPQVTSQCPALRITERREKTQSPWTQYCIRRSWISLYTSHVGLLSQERPTTMSHSKNTYRTSWIQAALDRANSSRETALLASVPLLQVVSEKTCNIVEAAQVCLQGLCTLYQRRIVTA